MYRGEHIDSRDRADFYTQLTEQLCALMEPDLGDVANLANAAALIYLQMPDLNWAGFYLVRDEELILGPFQGKPACTRIALGSGVCGVAAEERATQVVPDVHAFPGHIACDPESRSELVVPLVKDGQLLGVLDLDSPRPARFDAMDGEHMEAFAAALAEYLEA